MYLPSNLTNVLSILADCYTPILFFIALIDIVRNWKAANKFYSVQPIYAAIIVYLWMFIDERYQLWMAFGLDYSTHSAAAFSLMVVISLGKSRVYQCGLVISLIAYGYLMYLLNYHSWGDMLSTLCVITVFLLPLLYMFARKASAAPNI